LKIINKVIWEYDGENTQSTTHKGALYQDVGVEFFQLALIYLTEDIVY